MKPSESKRDDGVELESQLIMRMPEEPAKILREAIREGANNLKDRLTVKIENDMRYGEVRLDHWLLHAKIVDVPTIIESMKTIDGKSFYKTADVCQLIICKDEPDLPTTDDESPNKNVKKKDPNKVDKKYLWPHGITPPCKNIRKRRFRKTLKKKFVEAPEIEKEVKRLLRADNEAVKCSWDLVTDDQDDHKNIQSLQNELGMPETGRSMAGGSGGNGKRNKMGSGKGGGGSDSQQMPRDIDIFGEDLSSSDDDDHHNINVELDETSRMSADSEDEYSMNGNNSSSNAQQDKHLVTEFNKSMFRGDDGSPKSGQQTPPHRRTGGRYDNESDDNTEFGGRQMSRANINQRVAQLHQQLADLGQRRVQKELEIASIENQALRQRLQDSLDQILGQILDREILLADLQTTE